MTTIAGERVAAVRRGLAALRRCGCDDHDAADHIESAILRFDEGAVAKHYHVQIEGYTTSGWVVLYADDSMSLYSDDGCYDEYAMVLRGAARRAAEAAIGEN